MKQHSPYVVITACRSVSQLKLDCAHDSLKKIVRSDDAAIRSAALGALNILWQQPDFDLIFSVFQNGLSEKVRRDAAWTLRENADKDNWEQLFEIWSIDPLHRHRVWACELAGQFGNEDHKRRLLTLLEDSNGHVKKAASRALERISC